MSKFLSKPNTKLLYTIATKDKSTAHRNWRKTHTYRTPLNPMKNCRSVTFWQHDLMAQMNFIKFEQFFIYFVHITNSIRIVHVQCVYVLVTDLVNGVKCNVRYNFSFLLTSQHSLTQMHSHIKLDEIDIKTSSYKFSCHEINTKWHIQRSSIVRNVNLWLNQLHILTAHIVDHIENWMTTNEINFGF